MAGAERLRFPVTRLSVPYLLEFDVAEPVSAPPNRRETRPLAPSCATCWGAGVIWESLEGAPRALVPLACWTCGGAGAAPGRPA